MSKSLAVFMNPQATEVAEYAVSSRFKDEKGNPVKWELRPISSAENDQLMRKHIKRSKKGSESFDRIAYINELITTAVVYPDLNNAELQKAWGVLGSTQLIGKMLLAGEFAALSQKVQEISGIETEEELIEEVKN